MADDFNIIHLDDEQVQAIIDWAVSTAAMVHIMESAPEHQNIQQAMDRLEGYIEAVDIIVENMPDVLIGPAVEVAHEAVENALHEEEQVEQFREELKDL